MSVLYRLFGAKPKQGSHGRGTADTASGACDVDLTERQAETDAEEEQERRIPDIMADIEQAFPVGDTEMDDEARNEFLMSVSRAIDEQIEDLDSINGAVRRDLCHKTWNRHHPDMQMFLPNFGRYGREMPELSSHVVTAYQGMTQSEKTGHTVPDPTRVHLICRVTGKDVTDEIHHADFVRRQALNDMRRGKTASFKRERASDELQDAYDEATQRWHTVLEKYGYECHAGETGVIHGIMSINTETFSKWLAYRYHKGEGADTELDPRQ